MSDKNICDKKGGVFLEKDFFMGGGGGRIMMETCVDGWGVWLFRGGGFQDQK